MTKTNTPRRTQPTYEPRRPASDTLNLRVANLITSGVDPLDALHIVCGRDVVDAMIDSLYYQLRGEATWRAM